MNGHSIWYDDERKEYVYGSGIYFKMEDGRLSQFCCPFMYDYENKEQLHEELKRLNEWCDDMIKKDGIPNGTSMVDLRFLQKRWGKVEIV